MIDPMDGGGRRYGAVAAGREGKTDACRSPGAWACWPHFSGRTARTGAFSDENAPKSRSRSVWETARATLESTSRTLQTPTARSKQPALPGSPPAPSAGSDGQHSHTVRHPPLRLSPTDSAPDDAHKPLGILNANDACDIYLHFLESLTLGYE